MTRNRSLDAIAGLLAAAVALGVGELMAALTDAASLVIAVGDVIIDYTPGAVVRTAIEELGSNNKPALVTSIVAGTLALGTVLGVVAGRYRPVGIVALILFGLIGAIAATRDPFTSPLIATLNAGAAALAGWVALTLLLGAATPSPAGAGSAVMPGTGTADRRRFLGFAAGAAGAAAISAVTGRGILGPRVDVEEQREALTLPSHAPLAIAQAMGFDVPHLAALVTPNDRFYRIDTALAIPRIDAEQWAPRITGMVDHPYQLTFDELVSMASIEESVTLACVSNEVGGNLVGNAIWLGVPLAELLERAGVQAGATQIVGRSVDGFTVGFPTEVALDGRSAMIAVGMNGEPLPARHGFPARLVVPGLYGYVSATKWLAEIELTTWEGFDAYWIPRGWAKEAPIKTQSRIDVPRIGSRLPVGPVTVAGVAWGGIRGIERVEVRTGESDGRDGEWRDAMLSEALSESSWRQWLIEWEPAAPGEYRIEVRATDGEGQVQTEERSRPAPDGATGYHQRTIIVESA